MINKNQRCSQCIMDTSDTNIEFDNYGVCNHCHNYKDAIKVDQKEKITFETQLKEMQSINNQYNCVVGVSGGLDSSFLLLHVVKDLKLRPLAVHIDNGWNTGLANQNIYSQLTILGVDLHTAVLDWEEFRLMQLSILDAGVPDLEAPTDLFINYTLRSIAKKYGIKHILFGTNPQTEAVMASNWSYGQRDPIYLADLFRRYTGKSSKKLPLYNWYMVLLRNIKTNKIVRPLKFINFVKKEAVLRCVDEINWIEYPRKHGESFITRFYQNYFLPVRFGFDKRKAHLSSLILNNDISRDDAITILDSEEIYKKDTIAEIEYLCKKLQISIKNYNSFMESPIRFYYDYKNIKKTILFISGKRIRSIIGKDNYIYKKLVRIMTN